MKIHAASALAIAFVTAAGCATTGSPVAGTRAVTGRAVSYPTGYGTSTVTTSSMPASEAMPMAPPASVVGPSQHAADELVANAAGADRSLAEPAPAFRPGLATQWGETLGSAMSYEPFIRASAQPFDTASIFYNDARAAVQQAAWHQSAHGVSYAGAYNDGVRVSLRDEGGSPLPGYFASDRLYVLGQSGQRYTIMVENTTPARFEAVVSVDGLDVINGRTASTSQRGYILQPYSSVEVDGFRQDASTVAAFRFGSVADSYAAQTGSARNVGVIGVALFAEAGAVLQPMDTNELRLRESANPFPGAFATPPARRMY